MAMMLSLQIALNVGGLSLNLKVSVSKLQKKESSMFWKSCQEVRSGGVSL